MNYYKSLGKEEKKNIKVEFLKSKDDCLVYGKANKIYIYSIIGIVVSIIATIFDYIFKVENNTNTINFILDGLLFAFSLFFLIKMIIMKQNELNNYALKKSQENVDKKNKKQKKGAK